MSEVKGKYCESCGLEGCRTMKVAGANVCAGCKKILSDKGIK